MKRINQIPNPSGAYPPIQEGNFNTIPSGMAKWPDDLDTAVFYEHCGFVTLDIEEVDGVPTVVGCTGNTEAYNEWQASLPEPTEPDPTTEERVTALEEENTLLKAQVAAQSEQMDFYEECICEMAEVVYA